MTFNLAKFGLKTGVWYIINKRDNDFYNDSLVLKLLDLKQDDYYGTKSHRFNIVGKVLMYNNYTTVDKSMLPDMVEVSPEWSKELDDYMNEYKAGLL